MRAAALALVLAIALPARGDVDVAAAKRADKQRDWATLFLFIGAINAAVSLGSFLAIGLVPRRGGDAPSSVLPLELGAVGIASGAVAVPPLAAGITLRVIGNGDAFAASQSLGPDFFAARARRRRRLGVRLTLAGVGVIAVAAALGLGAWAALETRNADEGMPPLAAMSGVSAAAGLALVSVGGTLWAAGK